MLLDQMNSFLETTVVILLLTNAVSVAAAAYAIAVATGAAKKGRDGHVPMSLAGMWPSGIC